MSREREIAKRIQASLKARKEAKVGDGKFVETGLILRDDLIWGERKNDIDFIEVDDLYYVEGGGLYYDRLYWIGCDDFDSKAFLDGLEERVKLYHWE